MKGTLAYMNIILLVNKLTDGGAERVAALWATGFNEAGHRVTIIIKNSTAPISYSIPSASKIYRYDEAPSNSLKFMRVINKARWLRNIVKNEHANVIISIDPDMSLAMYLATRGLDVPIIHTAHNAFERPESAPMNFRTKVEKFYRNKLYSYITVLTQPDKEILQSKVKNVTVLPNPLSFIPAKQMPVKEKIVLASGRLDDWHCKGFDVLLRAWAKLGGLNVGWKLIISGGSRTGKGLEYLTTMCKELEIEDSVSFVGFQEDILSLYKKASIYVLSSRYEGFGMVLIEAMSQGCACVVCDYKGRQRDILGRDDVGIVLEPEDEEGIASGIERLINNESLRFTMGKAAIERSKVFNLDNIMQKWNKIIESVL